MFFRNSRVRVFLKLIGSIVNNTERINTKKEHNQLVHVTHPLIIPMIFIFLSCLEKAHDNKEFSCENSKL